MEILTPILIVGIIGLLAGVILAVASVVMAVPKDETAEALEEVLPGANCGACGFSGCPGYAAAMAKGEAKPGLCSPGGAEVAKKCAEILGGGDVEVAYKTALVHCLGSYDNTTDKMVYDGIQSCSASTFLAGGIASCRFGCMGMGDCVRACEYGAVTVCNGAAQIDPHKCKGCSKCVQACPKKLISFVPLKKQAVVRCSNCDKGRDTMKVCKIGCIGCGKCVKDLPQGRHLPEGQLRRGRPGEVRRLRPVRGRLPPAHHLDAGRIKHGKVPWQKLGDFFAFPPHLALPPRPLATEPASANPPALFTLDCRQGTVPYCFPGGSDDTGARAACLCLA